MDLIVQKETHVCAQIWKLIGVHKYSLHSSKVHGFPNIEILKGDSGKTSGEKDLRG